jgi:hypothetical protein
MLSGLAKGQGEQRAEETPKSRAAENIRSADSVLWLLSGLVCTTPSYDSTNQANMPLRDRLKYISGTALKKAAD